MADKQLARTGSSDFNGFSDDDPLSELARIVADDNRPALQQLQELEKHREMVRRDPGFDLEEELLRELGAYDAQASEVRASKKVREPEMVSFGHEPRPEATNAWVDQVVGAISPVAPAEDNREYLEQEISPAAQIFDTRADTSPAAGKDTLAARHEAVDLGNELELSIGIGKYPIEADDHPRIASKPLTPQPIASTTHAVFEESSLHDADIAPDIQGGDDLLADIERYPVPDKENLRPAGETTRKINYPFTPNFSRATPVASSAGLSQQRAFATPLIKHVAVQTMPMTKADAVYSTVETEEPVVMAAASTFQVDPVLPVEPEPEINLEDFELDLSDVELDMDAAEFMTLESDYDADPDGRDMAQPSPARSAGAEGDGFSHAGEQSEEALLFDPSMIAETEETVTTIGDLNVPQLPVIDQEAPTIAVQDYDLDIDAEIAQIFKGSDETEDQVDGDRWHRAFDPVPGETGTPYPGKVTPRVADDFDEFERVMEEDFRISLKQRRENQLVSPPSGFPEDDGFERQEPYRRRSSKRLLLACGAFAGVVLVGAAGAFAWWGGLDSAVVGTGDPQIILADKSPTKMVPVEKGGKTVPNQDKAVYDRVAGATQEIPQQGTLVSSTEDPVDVVQRTLTPETLPLDGIDDAADEAAPLSTTAIDNEDEERLLPDDAATNADLKADGAPALPPRKVRTMIVKPDGTLVAREEPAAIAKPVDDVKPSDDALPVDGAPASKTTLLTDERLAATLPASDATAAKPVDEAPISQMPDSALEQAAAAVVQEVPPADSTEAKPVEATPETTNEPILTARPTPRPVRQPVVREASAQPVQPPVAQPMQPEATAFDAPAQSSPAAAPGGYMVQIASLPSEAEAQRSYRSLSGKFASVIGGKGVDIKKAEIVGKGTFFRVRIPAGSREAANNLCASYKSAGGSCIVSR